MNAAELIRDWPGWSKANAETVFGSPAWCVRTEYAGGDARIVRTAELAPLVALDIRLDDAPNRLVIGECAGFADLMKLKGRFGGLPPEVVIALVERECGALLQTVENLVGRQLGITGLAAAETEGLERFELTGAAVKVGFAFRMDAAMRQRLGEVRNLDAGHEVIRAQRREAYAEYAELALLESELAVLASGDRLVIPEDAAGAWRTDAAEDDLVHVRAVAPTMISFAQFADDDLPAVPETEEVSLVRRGREIARGRFERLGLARTVRIK